MTHDELLAELDSQIESSKAVGCDCKSCDNAKALRAVVELHKPVQGSSDIQTYDYVGCDACVEWSHDGNMNLRYPCPTIKAIEEELL